MVCGACEAAPLPLGEDAHSFMVRALAQALTEAPGAAEQTLGQVERAISETLEHHAHLRLMPGRADLRSVARGRARRLSDTGIVRAVEEGLPIAYGLLDAGVPVLASDGTQVGTVASVLAAPEEDVFHGLLLNTPNHGVRFLEAADIASIHEHGVDLRIDATAALNLPAPEHAAPVFGEDPAKRTANGATGCITSPAAVTGNASAEEGPRPSGLGDWGSRAGWVAQGREAEMQALRCRVRWHNRRDERCSA